MKKILYYAAALLTMAFAASCQQEKLDAPAAKDGDLVEVTFEVSTADLQTKAVIGHNPDFDKTLQVGVYRDGAYLPDVQPVVTTDFGTGTTAKVKVVLVKGQKYDVAFWADAKETADVVEDYYTVKFDAEDNAGKNYPQITVDYETGAANDIYRDAWCTVLKDYKVTDKSIEGETITLTRPLAQINVGTKDYQLAVNAGVTVTGSAMTITNAATQLNMFTGETSAPVSVVLERSQIPHYFTTDPATPTTLTVYYNDPDNAPVEYDYLGLNYILVSNVNEPGYDKDIVTVELDFYEDGNDAPINDHIVVENVPVRRNFRTNLIANDVLTQEFDFTVVIDPLYYGEYVNGWVEGDKYTATEIDKILYKDAADNYTISTPEQLAFLSEVVNGGYYDFKGQTIKVVDDIDLKGQPFIPIGTEAHPFAGTIDGTLPVKAAEGCATIHNLVVKVDGHAGFIGVLTGTVKNINLNAPEVTGDAFVGALVGYAKEGASVENCSVEAPKVTNEAAELPDDATTVTTATGAVVGYAHPEAAVKDVAASDAKVESNNPEYTDKGDGLGFQGDLEITPEEPEEPEVPEQPTVTTVAEFLAAEENDETLYTLTGVITRMYQNSANDEKYGNFYLKDSTGEVLIYGLCSPEGDAQYWAESGAKLGDTITVKTVRTSYNNAPQGKNALFVELVPFVETLSEWGIVGDLTSWAAGSDIKMFTTWKAENLFVAYNVEIASGAFKIRANNEWNDAKNYGLEAAGKVYADSYYSVITSGGSQNITPMAYGTYDVYFDLANERVALVTPGKEYADAVAGGDPVVVIEGLTDHEWGLVGSFNGWDVANYVVAEVEGDWAVAKNVTLANGAEFKFAADKDWALSYGSACDVNVGETYTTYNNGGNMKFVGEDGAYNIYFSLVDAKFYMEAYSDVEEVTATITFDTLDKRTSKTNEQAVWEENGITVTNDKAASTSNIADYVKPARFYQNSNLTIAVDGEITSIVFDCNSSSYATQLANTLGVAASEDKVTVTLETPAATYVVENLGKQVRMDAITVTYNK